MSSIVFLVLLPGIMCLWLLRYRFQTKFSMLIGVLFSISYFVWFMITENWIFVSYYFRWLYTIIIFLACIAAIRNTCHRSWFKKSSGLYWMFISLFTMVTFVQLLASSFAIKQIFPSERLLEQAVMLEFPLKNGFYYIAHGGAHQLLNYHSSYLAQRYAVDIAKLNGWGLRKKFGFNRKPLEKFEIYEDIVYSPLDGKIAKVINKAEDHKIGESFLGSDLGNLIVIEAKMHYIFLLHLKKNSITVREGQFVEAGDEIAKVGNSGFSTEPHLHIHAIKKQSGNLLTAPSVPILFKGAFLKRNDVIYKGRVISR